MKQLFFFEDLIDRAGVMIPIPKKFVTLKTMNVHIYYETWTSLCRTFLDCLIVIHQKLKNETT